MDDDEKAWKVLTTAGYTTMSGMIYHPTLPPGHQEPAEVCLAIDYLCAEWDYGFIPYDETKDFLLDKKENE